MKIPFEEYAGVGIKVLQVFGGVVLLILVLRIYNTFLNPRRGKTKQLSRWARGIKFSAAQLTAMRSLWQCFKLHKPPTSEILEPLSPQELSDLIRKCELDSLPRRFRVFNEAKERQIFVQELKSKGFNGLEAQILCGMKFGRLGAANELE